MLSPPTPPIEDDYNSNLLNHNSDLLLTGVTGGREVSFDDGVTLVQREFEVRGRTSSGVAACSRSVPAGSHDTAKSTGGGDPTPGRGTPRPTSTPWETTHAQEPRERAAANDDDGGLADPDPRSTANESRGHRGAVGTAAVAGTSASKDDDDMGREQILQARRALCFSPRRRHQRVAAPTEIRPSPSPVLSPTKLHERLHKLGDQLQK